MTENTTPLELTEQDKLDLSSIGFDVEGEEEAPVQQHTLLEIWAEILSNIDTARVEHIDPAEATRVLRKWGFLKMQEVGAYRKQYFDHLSGLRDVLTDLIAEHPKALLNTENDAEANHDLYLTLLLNWQLEAQAWSLEWDYADEDSHIVLAGLADAQEFVLGAQGLIAHLDHIGFDLTEEDTVDLNVALTEAAEAAKTKAEQ